MLAPLHGKQPANIGVVAAHNPAQLVLHTCRSSPQKAAVSNQGAMFSQPWWRSMGLGDHSQGQKLGQDLSIQPVSLASALGDHPQLARMSKYYAVRPGLGQLHEPFVARSRLDNELKGNLSTEKTLHSRSVLVRPPSPLDHHAIAVP